jgi:hypothetical protein
MEEKKHISVIVRSKATAQQLEPFAKYFGDCIYVNPSQVNESVSECVTKRMGYVDESKIDGDWVVEIPNGCKINIGAMQRIQNMVGDAETQKKITHGAIPTTIEMSGVHPFYGFTLVCLAIDWIWNLLENGKLYQYTDIRITAMIKKGEKQRFLAPKRTSWRIWNKNCLQKEAPDGHIVTKWSPAIVREHLYLKYWPLWILPYLWWLLILAWGVTNIYVATLCLFQTIYALFIGKYYAKMDYLLLNAALFPVYWTLFPIYAFYEKN